MRFSSVWYIHTCATITAINFRTFSPHQKETPDPGAVTPTLPPPAAGGPAVPALLLLPTRAAFPVLCWASLAPNPSSGMYLLLRVLNFYLR